MQTSQCLTALGAVMALALSAHAVAEVETTESVSDARPGSEAVSGSPEGDRVDAAASSAEPSYADTAPVGSVARSAFTQEVFEREPQETLTSLANDRDRIKYFTELQGLDGDQVTHRWEFNGEVMAEVPFDVGSNRWRVHSSKRLDPSWIGSWTVTVLDGAGRELSRESFEYVAASYPAAPAADESGTATMDERDDAR